MSDPFFRLRPFGWSDRVAALFQPVLESGCEPARVIAVERGWVTVATAADDSQVLPEVGLAVGDWVGLQGGRVAETLPRWSTLERLDPGAGRQVMAANVDLVLIAAPGDRLSPARVERELVIAWDSGAVPVVVVTKADVTPDGAVEDLLARLGATDLVLTSARDGRGLDQLRAMLGPPTTAALFGPSGAGKSTLVNALVGAEVLPVGEVREDDRRGRHTTTIRRLVPLPTGGSLIDMPGLRSLATDASAASVAAAFPEIDELSAGCRFSDCTHQIEPDCEVVAACERGELDPDRLASFRKLDRELAHERRRVDPLLRQAETKNWKAIHKAQRSHPKRGRR